MPICHRFLVQGEVLFEFGLKIRKKYAVLSYKLFIEQRLIRLVVSDQIILAKINFVEISIFLPNDMNDRPVVIFEPLALIL